MRNVVNTSQPVPELDVIEIAELSGYSRQAICIMIERRDFPPADCIGKNNRRLWKKTTVLEWLLANEQRIGARYRAFRKAIADIEAELGMR